MICLVDGVSSNEKIFRDFGPREKISKFHLRDYILQRESKKKNVNTDLSESIVKKAQNLWLSQQIKMIKYSAQHLTCVRGIIVV
jgi:hypothetical protein